MLSNHALSTPRPRPPAKTRRDASVPLHPPPPYAPSMDMLVESTLQVSAQFAGSPPGEAGSLHAPTMEEWMHERSREELSDLLVAAEDIIKTRETELGFTSTLCKNLYQENVQLKNKHDALLTRLPGQGPSPLPSPTRSLSPLPPGSPHYYSLSRPHSPVSSSPMRVRHARRISVTPGELSLLADQNGELLEKLEKLEEESAQADLAGKRKLRKLEREIQGLREELEKTRAKSAELEAKAEGVLSLGEEEAIRRQKDKEERAERTKALRERVSGASSASSSAESTVGEPVRDFAPPPELPLVKNYASPGLSPVTPVTSLVAESSTLLLTPDHIPPSTANVSSPRSDPLPVLACVSEQAHLKPASCLQPGDPLLSTASVYLPQGGTAPSLEYAIISQLLSKIKELEETNTQITTGQRVTEQKLQDAQWDAESIKRAYDCLVDEEGEVHMLAEADSDDEAEDESGSLHESSSALSQKSNRGYLSRKRVPTGDTIRFSSLRRTIDGDISRESTSTGVFSTPASPNRDQIDIDFAQGIRKEMQSTTRSRMASIPAGHNIHKTRKTVMGLFDTAEAADCDPLESPQAGAYPRELSVSPAFLGKTNLVDISAWSTNAVDGERYPSVSPSTSAYPSPMHSPSPSTPFLNTNSLRRNAHTLGSEIGAEDWPLEENGGGWNYHLRTSSLCDLTGMTNADGVDGNASSRTLPGNSTPHDGSAEPAMVAKCSPSPSAREPSPPASGWEDISDDNEASVGPSVTKSRSAASVETATPTKGPLGKSNGLQLHFVVEPPTPSPNKLLRASRSTHSLRVPMHSSASTGLMGEGGARELHASRNARLSQTMRARTSRWVEKVERRYAFDPDQPLDTVSTPTRSHTLRKRKSPASVRGYEYEHARRISSAMDETFDEVLVQFSRSSLSISGLTSQEDLQEANTSLASCDENEEADVSLSAEVMAARPRREGFVGLLLEVWLWLQFAIVVMVFLWAMARRGPKTVLEDAERRRGLMRRTASY